MGLPHSVVSRSLLMRKDEENSDSSAYDIPPLSNLSLLSLLTMRFGIEPGSKFIEQCGK